MIFTIRVTVASMPSLSPLRASLRPFALADLEGQIAAHAARGGDLIDLHIGDTYLEPPQTARLAGVLERTGDGADLYRYGETAGLSPLRDAIADDLRRRGRVFADVCGEKNVLLGAGATHAIFCAAAAVLSPGDDVILAAPYWPLAHGIILASGAHPVEVPFTSRLYAEPELDAGSLLRAALTPSTRAIYLTSPNNPDGKVLSKTDLESVAALAIEEDLWVFADEVYADVTYGRPHVSLASLPGMAARTITAYSFSKSHALAGLRVGYVVAPEAVVRVAQRVSNHSIFNVPVAMQRAAAAALASGSRWTERAVLLYRRSLEAVTEALDGTGVRYSTPEGGVFVFLDFSDVLGDRPLRALLERSIARGVLVAPGAGFGKDFTKHARLCFSSQPLPQLVEGLTRLVAATRDLRA
jgi:aspartate/methionine/tyrosine aminotransferase